MKKKTNCKLQQKQLHIIIFNLFKLIACMMPKPIFKKYVFITTKNVIIFKFYYEIK